MSDRNAAIRALIEHRFPDATPVTHRTAEPVATGIDALDVILPGHGLPRGRLTVWMPQGGATAVLRAACHTTVAQGERAVWIDGLGTVAGPFWEEGPILVRPRNRKHGLRGAEELLRCGGFALVVIAGLEPEGTETVRLSRAASEGGGAMVILTSHASMASLRVTSQILREKIKKVASHLLEAAAGDIDVADGLATVTGTDRAVTFKQIAKAVYSDMKTLPVEARQELEASYTYDPINGTTACATHLAAVEVDPTTCFVKIHKYVVAEDCGRIINPMIVDGQVHGGVAQGIGAALYEEVIYDEDGQLVSASLADYVIPSAVEIPHMDVVHIESCSAVAGGFRGMGEGGTIGAPAAIANAVSDALSPLDIQVSILPITPERIFGLLEQARTKAKGSRQ